MNDEQQFEQLKQIIRTLEPYERLEIKLENEVPGRVEILRKSNRKHIIVVDTIS